MDYREFKQTIRRRGYTLAQVRSYLRYLMLHGHDAEAAMVRTVSIMEMAR